MKIISADPNANPTADEILATLRKFQEGIREELKDIATVEEVPPVSWALDSVPKSIRDRWTDVQITSTNVDRITLTFGYHHSGRIQVQPLGWHSKLSRAWRGDAFVMAERLAEEARPGSTSAGRVLTIWHQASRYRELVLGLAFHMDTQGYNSSENCRLATRCHPAWDPLDTTPWVRSAGKVRAHVIRRVTFVGSVTL